jgi:arylsulfatase A-like enzyme
MVDASAIGTAAHSLAIHDPAVSVGITLLSISILDDTLILFIADDDRPFPRAKRWQTEEGMRTPWILDWPDGLTKSRQLCDQLVSVIDIAPTFLTLAGWHPGPAR